MTKIICSHGGKGGVGKTSCILAFADYLETHGVAYIPFETDRENPGFYSRLSHNPNPVSVRVAVISEAEAFDDAGNSIVNAALDAGRDEYVVVDLPASVTPALKAFVENNGVLDILEDEGIELTFLFVSDASPDSCTILSKHLAYFGSATSTCVLKNMGVNKQWDYFDKNNHLQELMRECGARVVDFPALHGKSTMEKLKQHNLSFTAGRTSPLLDRVDRQRVQMFLKKAHMAFAGLEILSLEVV